MKKVFVGLVILLASFTTIYTIFFWEPKSVEDMVNLGAVTNEDVNSENGEKEVESKEEEESKEVSVDVDPILKVSVEDIYNEMPRKDYEELKKVITTMSTSDIGMIEDTINGEDKESGMRNAISILKTRLSSEDYEKIKNILSPYVNFNNIKILDMELLEGDMFFNEVDLILSYKENQQLKYIHFEFKKIMYYDIGGNFNHCEKIDIERLKEGFRINFINKRKNKKPPRRRL